MSAKTKSDVKVLKGQEAEDKILEYVKKMNRPYGAVDVAANLKGTVAKATTQKILVALAEKGELVQKNYAKSSFFVFNQAKAPTLSPEQIAALDEEYKKIDEENKSSTAQIKTANTELLKIKNTPSDNELDEQLSSLETAIAQRSASLKPLRSGAPMISAEDIAQIDADWVKWRTEWVRRKKIFNSFWQIVTDALSPQDAIILAEDLGIEHDTPEHATLEKSSLCTAATKNSLKRKR